MIADVEDAAGTRSTSSNDNNGTMTTTPISSIDTDTKQLHQHPYPTKEEVAGPRIKTQIAAGSSTSGPPSNTTTTATAPVITKKKVSTSKTVGESHRIYWQQWVTVKSSPALSTSSPTTTAVSENAPPARQHTTAAPAVVSDSAAVPRRELVTSSAAVRLSRSARAFDVTNLLRQTLQLGPLPQLIKDLDNEDKQVRSYPYDSLVLVGTINSFPQDYIQYDHDSITATVFNSVGLGSSAAASVTQLSPVTTAASGSNSVDTLHGGTATTTTSGLQEAQSSLPPPVHFIKTLEPTDKPLLIRDKMNQYLDHLIAGWHQLYHHQQQQQQKYHHPTKSIIQPTSSIQTKLQWYFIPSCCPDETNNDILSSTETSSKAKTVFVPPTSFIPNCIEFPDDGYCTSMENEKDEEESSDDEEDDVNDVHYEERCSYDTTKQRLVTRFPWLYPTNNASKTATIVEGNDNNKDEVDNLSKDTSIAQPKSEKMKEIAASPLFLMDEEFHKLVQRQEKKKKQKQRQLLMKAKRRKDFTALLSSSSLSQQQQSQQPSSSSYTNYNDGILSGYLLKRDRYDLHVWRRVYCTMTDDDFWYDSRVYTRFIHVQQKQQQSETEKSPRIPTAVRYTNRGRIRLLRTSLVQPSADYLPLFRTPYAFEIVSASGRRHVFRAATAAQQTMWLRAISERTVQSYENRWVDNAELILADLSLARNQRIHTIASEALWDQIENECSSNNTQQKVLKKVPSTGVQSNLLGVVLRWGIQVAEYRESCRYVHSILPAKNPVVVSAAAPPPPATIAAPATAETTATTSTTSSISFFRRSGSSQAQKSNSTTTGATTAGTPSVPTPDPMDPTTKDMIRSLWERSATLLARASHIAHTMLEQPKKVSLGSGMGITSSSWLIGSMTASSSTSSSSFSHHHHQHSHIETLCRHIDYVITGRFRPIGGGNITTSSISKSSQMNDATKDSVPPPMDLFDPLLAELQKLAACHNA